MKIFTLALLSFLLVSCTATLPFKEVKEEKKLFVSWNKELDPPYDTGNLPIALNGPLIRDEIVYIGSALGQMSAYDLQDGRLIWQTQDGGGFHDSPASHKDQVLYGTLAGRIISRHYLNGKLKFEVDVGSPVETTPVIADGRLYANLRDHRLIAIDVETGKILWAYKRSVPQSTTLQRMSSPLLAEGKLYVGFADGYLVKLAIEDGSLLWEQKISDGAKFVDVDNIPFWWNGQILIGSLTGKLSLVDPKSGAIIRRLEIYPSRAPVSFEKNLLVPTSDGNLVLLDQNLSPIRKEQVAKSPITNVDFWQKELIVTTTRGEVMRLHPTTFEVLEKKELGHAISAVFGDLALTSDRLAIFSSRNRLYIYGRK